MIGPDATDDEFAKAGTAVGTQCLSFATRRTANLMTRAYAEHLAPLGLEMSQFAVLCAVAAGRANSARQLADTLGLERSTLARNLTRLLAGKLLAATPGAGRRIAYRLTEAGRARFLAALPAWEAAQRALRAQLRPGIEETARASLAELRSAALELIQNKG